MMMLATPDDNDSDNETIGPSEYSFATSSVMTCASATNSMMTSAASSCASSVCQDVNIDWIRITGKRVCYF